MDVLPGEPSPPEPTAASAASPSLVPPALPSGGTDRFDEAIVVTRTRAWIGLSACLALVAAIFVWALTAEVGVTVKGNGVVLANGAIAVVQSPVAGTVQSLNVKVGDSVTAAQVVGSVADSQNTISPLVAPVTGRVLDVNESVGSTIASGGPAASISQASGPLLFRAFLTPTQAQQVDTGTRAILAVPGQPNVEGRVTDVGSLPLTVDQVGDSIGSVALASLLAKGGAVVPVTVAPAAPTSPHLALDTGDVASVTLIIGSQHPISYIF